MDGKKIGTTPLNYHRVDSGKYHISVRKEWYLPKEDQMVVVNPGPPAYLTYSLERIFSH